MKIKIVKGLSGYGGKHIKPGSIFEARVFSTRPFQSGAPFQIIEGEFSGIFVQQENAIIHVENDDITYTEKEYEDLKKFYIDKLEKEKKQSVLFQTLARELGNEIKKKNKEIERLNFFLDASSTALMAACESIEVLKRESK